MTHKTKKCYLAVLKYIKAKIFDFDAAKFMTDFEAGMRSAIKKCYPRAIIRGCWYHYAAALRKRMRTMGMTKLFKEQKKAKDLKNMLMHLPLLPAEMFERGYSFIKEQAKSWRLFNSFKKFFVYYERQWINEVLLIFVVKPVISISKILSVFHRIAGIRYQSQG